MEIEFGNECKEEQPLKEIAMGFGKFDYETMDSAERSLVRKKRKNKFNWKSSILGNIDNSFCKLVSRFWITLT